MIAAVERDRASLFKNAGREIDGFVGNFGR